MNTQTIFGAQFVLSLVAFGIVAELRGSGVTATVLSPTFTRSPAASSPRTTSTSTWFTRWTEPGISTVRP